MHRLFVGLVLALVTTAGLLLVENHYRPRAYQGLYFQAWSSERMMQTLSIEDLRNEPLRSLWYLHIQPPAFDVIRAFLAQVVVADNPATLLWWVDYCLYILWALLYGMTVFVVFWWLSDTTAIGFAALSALLFSAHPALVLYATLLETTLLSTFLILCFCYLLWRIAEGRSVPVGILAVSFLSLYFTRSLFQWPWLLLMPFCLTLLGLPRRKVMMFFAITSFVAGMYTVKQLSLFGLSSTSSFTGINLCKSLGIRGVWKYYGRELAPDEEAFSSGPRVLSRIRKIDGALNYNNMHYLEINSRLQQEYRRYLLASSPRQLASAALLNLKYFLKPSSWYTDHFIVDRLPWRSAYNYMASSPVLPLLLIAAFLFWLCRTSTTRYPQTLGLCLPVVCIFILCVIFERGENMRYKFFIEPVLFCFLATQAYAAGRESIRYLLTKAFIRQDAAR